MTLGPGHSLKPYPGNDLGDFDLLNSEFEKFMETFPDVSFISIEWVDVKLCEKYLVSSTSPERSVVLNIANVNNLDVGLVSIITSAVIDGKFGTTTLKSDMSGFFQSGDNYIAVLDEDVVYGATLVAEYSIHIYTPNYALDKIKIKEPLPENCRFLTSNRSENEYNYNLSTNTLYFTISQPSANENVIKFRIEKTINSSSDIQEFTNTAKISYWRDGTKKIKKLNSKQKITIIPPFGINKTTLNVKIFVKISLITLIIVFIILTFKFRKAIFKYFHSQSKN